VQVNSYVFNNDKKVKVNFTPEQTMKAHRRKEDIAIFLL